MTVSTEDAALPMPPEMTEEQLTEIKKRMIAYFQSEVEVHGIHPMDVSITAIGLCIQSIVDLYGPDAMESILKVLKEGRGMVQ
jgi:hypothetical protein